MGTPKQQLIYILEKHGLAKNGRVFHQKVAELTGLKHETVKSTLRPGSDEIPKWLNLVVYMFENKANRACIEFNLDDLKYINNVTE